LSVEKVGTDLNGGPTIACACVVWPGEIASAAARVTTESATADIPVMVLNVMMQSFRV
jgi:hypothetical protein